VPRIWCDKTSGKVWKAFCGAVRAAGLAPGYFEKNLNRQGELLLFREEPLPDSPWYARRAQVVLPGQPRKLDFVMLPAAAVEEQAHDPN